MDITKKEKYQTLVEEVLPLSSYRDLVVNDEQLWWKDFKALLKFIKRNRINLFCPSEIEYFVLNVFAAGNKVECVRYHDWIVEQQESYANKRLTEDQVGALESIPGWIWFSEDLESLQKNIIDIYLIDFHRVKKHYCNNNRGIIKDLGALYFSMIEVGLTKDDLLIVENSYIKSRDTSFNDFKDLFIYGPIFFNKIILFVYGVILCKYLNIVIKYIYLYL